MNDTRKNDTRKNDAMATMPHQGIRGPFRILLVLLTGFLILSVPLPACAGDATTAYTAGLNYTQARDYANALAAFDQAIGQNNQSYEAWNGKADVLNRMGRYNESLEAVDTALAINASYLNGWINRGAILYNLGRYDDELASYDRAIAIDPASDVAWFNRAYSLAALGRYDESLAAFGKVKELNPAYPYLKDNINNAIALQQAEQAKEDSERTQAVVLPCAVALIVAVVLIGGYLWHREKARGAAEGKTRARK